MSVQRNIMEIINRVPLLVAIPSVIISMIIVNNFSPKGINSLSWLGAYFLVAFSFCYIQGKLNKEVIKSES